MDQLLGPKNVQSLLSTIDHLYGTYLHGAGPEAATRAPATLTPSNRHAHQPELASHPAGRCLHPDPGGYAGGDRGFDDHHFRPHAIREYFAKESMQHRRCDQLDGGLRAPRCRRADLAVLRPRATSFSRTGRGALRDLSSNLDWWGPPGDRRCGIDIGQAHKEG